MGPLLSAVLVTVMILIQSGTKTISNNNNNNNNNNITVGNNNKASQIGRLTAVSGLATKLCNLDTCSFPAHQPSSTLAIDSTTPTRIAAGSPVFPYLPEPVPTSIPSIRSTSETARTPMLVSIGVT